LDPPLQEELGREKEVNQVFDGFKRRQQTMNGIE